MTEIKITCYRCSEENRVMIDNSNEVFKCKNCNETLFSTEEIRGWIYILSNPSMPDLFKIGFTERNVRKRVNELSNSTGVPTEFIVEVTLTTKNPQQDESKIHKNLSQYRVNKGHCPYIS